MIHEIDDALRTILRADPSIAGKIHSNDIVFDAPTKGWATRLNAPTIDLYLYDIHEDARRREAGRTETRNADGRVQTRGALPRWFKLSYLVTAWTKRAEDEHRLLSDCLGCFLRRDSLPRDAFTGSLADVLLPVPYTVALPPPEDRALSDTWSALGGDLKPSLDLVVIAPFDTSREVTIERWVLEPPGLPREREQASALLGAPVVDERAGGSDDERGRIVRLRELPRNPE